MRALLLFIFKSSLIIRKIVLFVFPLLLGGCMSLYSPSATPNKSTIIMALFNLPEFIRVSKIFLNEKIQMTCFSNTLSSAML